ncbi:MAG: hypothetical protein A3I12_01325 [Gammaproteobacteria bacterium RIFCSPLOWO2_02_FULL_38_11]|nr:MAG: hypothetical protein A3B69_05430 [Gammaproteobacteria bacterium RIFCSPHIGHO2_02_FULL_38_33]OGT24557.1 MAG: hypothetical protein A2W47_02230 [Gammaproteobacteria bacterium RIFCSPHIGHO2_12_38_15]OGT67624.1 MAG: hypothetical protein A3I12_01325 [Gammaproteobacteria bacterium RIFCSPLOWO2_02_FULL_38_11]OGT75645.1 MAG: hypothetical protein A3G71_00175 [Gammaproteobacteria bacterium RIFCSPLOWO2_12_FULL_38_14]
MHPPGIASTKTLSYSDSRTISTNEGLILLPDHALTISEIYSHSFQLWRIIFSKVIFFALLFTALPLLASEHTLYLLNFFYIASFKVKIIFSISFSGLISLFSYATYLTKLNMLLTQKPLSLKTFPGTICLKTIFLIFASLISFVALILGYAALIIPGIYIFGILFIYYPLLITNNIDPIRGFLESVFLIKDHWWRTFISIILPSILYISLSACIRLYAHHFFPDFHNPIIQMILRFVLEVLFVSIFSIFILTQSLLLLNDLKLRKNNP